MVAVAEQSPNMLCQHRYVEPLEYYVLIQFRLLVGLVLDEHVRMRLIPIDQVHRTYGFPARACSRESQKVCGILEVARRREREAVRWVGTVSVLPAPRDAKLHATVTREGAERGDGISSRMIYGP